MDTEKLQQILELIEADEKEFSIQPKIDEIRNLISQNAANTVEQASLKVDELFEVVRESRAGSFTNTEVELLENINADQYFGEGLIESLEELMSTKSFEVAQGLTAFGKDRQTKVSKLNQLRGLFTEMGVKPYKQPLPEVALKLPSELLAIDEVADRLKKFSHFLNAVQAPMTKSKTENIKLTRMNKGSGEFFFGVQPETAVLMLSILADLATVVAVAHQIRNSVPKVDKQYVDPEDAKALNEKVEEIAKKSVDKFLAEIPQKIAKDVSAEQATNVKKHAQILFKWIPLGVHFEVVFDKTVETSSKENLSEDKLKLETEKRQQLESVKDMYELPLQEMPLLPEQHNEEGAEDD